MKDYLFIFRADWAGLPEATLEEQQARTQKWMDWINGIAAENRLADRGNRLSQSGRVMGVNGTITDGPYAEIKETIGGYSVIKAESYEAATRLASGCPVLKIGGTVEIREISAM